MLLRWHYGDQLSWRLRMIVLTLEPGEAEKLARGAPSLQRRYGMPIDPAPRERPASSEPACLAVVAARLHAPEAEEPLLRRLRVRTMAGGLLDDQQLIDGAARDAEPRSGRPEGVVRHVRGAGRAERRRGRRALAVAGGARARRSPRRAARAAALHRTELRVPPRRQRRRLRPAGLQPDRGVRRGDREPRARAANGAPSPTASRRCSRGPASRSPRPRSPRSCGST